MAGRKFGTLAYRAVNALLRPFVDEPALTFALAAILCAHNLLRLLNTLWGNEEGAVGIELLLPNLAMGWGTAYALALAAALLNKRWARIAATLLAAIPMALHEALEHAFGLTLSPTAALLLLQTNAREAAEFAGTYLLSSHAAVAILLMVLIVAAPEVARGHIKPRSTAKLPSWTTATLALCVLISALYGLRLRIPHFALAFDQDFNAFTLRHGRHADTLLQPTSLPLNSLCFTIGWLRFNGRAYQRYADRQWEILEHPRNHVEQAGTDSLTLMLVIGESHIKSRSQLYGYPLRNQPWLTEQRDSGAAIVFNNVVTTANHTTEALADALTTNDPAEGETFDQSAFLPALLHADGYQCHILDNQISPPRGEALAYDQGAVRLLYVNNLWHTVLRKQMTYDAALLDSLPKTNEAREFILVHLLGQHFPYKARFPADADLKLFTTYDVQYADTTIRPWMTADMWQLEADYANATLYNDHVLSLLATSLQGRPGLLVYFGDHGEELYDAGPRWGRQMPRPGEERNFMRCQAEVPLLVWVTSEYAKQHPERLQVLRAAANKPISLASLPQLVMALTNTQAKEYRPERDPLNNKYRAPRRIVNLCLDYDQVMAIK